MAPPTKSSRELSMQAGDIAGATREVRACRRSRPDDVTLELKAGIFFCSAANSRRRKRTSAADLNEDGRNVDAQILAANALAGLKNVDAAISRSKMRWRSSPERSSAYSNLGALN